MTINPFASQPVAMTGFGKSVKHNRHSSSLKSPHCYGKSLLPATRQHLTFPPLPQLKLVFDLAIPEGCTAKLT